MKHPYFILGFLVGSLVACLFLLLASCATDPNIEPTPKVSQPVQVRSAVARLDVFGPTPIPPAAVRKAAAGRTVTLVWDPSPDATVTGYFLYAGTASGVYSNKMDAGSQTNCTVAGLISGTNYFFACTAYTENQQLESPFSNEVSYNVVAKAVITNNAVALTVQASDTPAGPWVDLGAAWVLPSAGHAQVYRLLIEPTNLPPVTNATWPLKVTIINTK